MNNMKQGIKGITSNLVGKMAIKTGEQALENACYYYFHETKIPTELLKKSK